MNKKLAFIVLLSLPLGCFAAEFLNGQGLFYTQPAEVNLPGQYNVSLFQRAFVNFGDTGPGSQLNTSANFSYGLLKKLELELTQVLYRDLYNLGTDESEAVIPGQTYIHIKYANWETNFSGHPVLLGMAATTSFRTTDKSSGYLETPYTGGGVEGGVQLLATYYTNPEYTEESDAVHLNLGFVNYNDADEIMKSTQAIPYSFAFVRSDLQKELFVEAHGAIYVERAAPGYTNTSYMYLSPGYKHKFSDKLNLAVSLDLRVFGAEPDFVFNDLPAYSAYRLNIAVTGLFNRTRYVGPKQLQELDDAERRALQAEEELKARQQERMELEKKVDEQNKEKQQKQDELDNLKKKTGK